MVHNNNNSTRENTIGTRDKILTTKPMVLRYSEVAGVCPFQYNYYGSRFVPCVSPRHINQRYGFRDGKCHYQRGFWIGTDSVPRIKCGFWMLPAPVQPVQLQLF